MKSTQGIRSGAIAGAVSAVAFALLHDLLISDIWSTLVVMLPAGVVCGLCVGWSYALLFPAPSLRSWVGYNLIYLVMFLLLGVASVLIFEPVTTVAALIAANEPPNELFALALPMTAGFALAFALLLCRLYGQHWSHYAAICITTVVLIALLGLNVSVLGLVYVPRGSGYLIAELFVLIIVLDVVLAVVFFAMERRLLTGPN